MEFLSRNKVEDLFFEDQFFESEYLLCLAQNTRKASSFTGFSSLVFGSILITRMSRAIEI